MTLPDQGPPIAVRFGRAEDVEPARTHNDAAVPAVNALPGEAWTRLVQQADLFGVAALVGRPGGSAQGLGWAGFVLCFGPGHDYQSDNYRWFQDTYATPSLYVDRVVVAASARGSGVGKVLYAAVFDEARRRGLSFVTCEVNAMPPNPASLAFHRRLGFREVGQQATEGGAKQVILLERAV